MQENRNVLQLFRSTFIFAREQQNARFSLPERSKGMEIYERRVTSMKKLLAMVLALVMTLSLAVSANAAFKDDKDISADYAEAVAVLDGMGVFKGYEDGSFKPEGNITRAEVATIVYRIYTADVAKNDKSGLYATYNKFSDMAGAGWAQGYIGYCANASLVKGYPDGTFKPSGKVTGYEVLAMILRAVGYDKNNEFSGADWALNVAKYAEQLGILKNVAKTTDLSAPASRELVAELLFQAIQKDMVTYTPAFGYVTDKVADLKQTSIGYKNFKLASAAASDKWGRPATKWTYNTGDKATTFVEKPDLTYTKAVKASDIYKDLALGSTIDKKDVTVYINGEEAEDAAVVLKKSNDAKIGKDYLEKSGKKYSTAKNGVLTEVFYDKDDDSVIITQVVTYVGQINKSVAATSKKDAYVVIDTLSSTQNVMAVPSDLTGKTVSKSLEFETDDKFEDDDYVLYTYSQTADEVKSVAAAEKVEGYVSKTTNSTKDEDENKGITIADTAYKMSAATTGEPLGEVSVKNDYTAYLDQYGYVIYVEEIEEIGNYALLINVADKGTFVGKKAELVFTDGTSKVVTTEKDYSKADNLKYDVNNDGKFTDADTEEWSKEAGVANGQKKPVIVTYKVDNDGVYTLKAVDVAKSSYKVASDALNLKNDKASISVDECTVNDVKDTTYVTANSATQFVVADAGSNEDFTAYTGIKNAPTIAAGKTDGYKTDVFFYCKNGKMVTVMFVLPQSKVTIEDDNNKMIFFAKESGSDLEHDKDSNYFEYNAIVNGEIKTVKVDENATGLTASGANGLFKSFTTDKYGVVSGVKKYNAYGDGLDANPKTQPGDAKEYLAGVGIDKVSKEYTVILNTTGGNLEDGTTASIYTNETISCDDAMKVYYVDKDGNITESSYKSIAKDDNDNVYAIVQDYLVKTLIIQEVESEDDVYGVKVVSTGNATVKVDGSKYAAGKTAEYDKNDEDVVITVTADKDYTIKTVKIDGEGVELDKNGQYTISKIKGLYKLEVETEKVADATMTISVQYVLDDNAGTVVKSEKPAKMIADKGEDYVTVHGTAPDGYTLVSAAKQYVTFVANGSATVKFTVKTTTP